MDYRTGVGDHEIDARECKTTEGAIEFGFTPDKWSKKRKKTVLGIVEQIVTGANYKTNANLIDTGTCQLKS